MAEISSVRCRLCFQKKFQLLPMFPANEPVNDDLLRKIWECASVRIVYEDDQNSVICIKCIVDVEQFYSFKERCIQNDLLCQQMRQEHCLPIDEEDFDPIEPPEMDLIEPVTSFVQTDTSPGHMEAFFGEAKLTRIGYNYRVVCVNHANNILIYRKHRYYQPDNNSDHNSWQCVAKGTTNCPAKLMISSTVSFPLALFNRRIKHNHPEATVQTVGAIEAYSEEMVKALQKYTLVVNSQLQLRLLAGGYRFRLRQALFSDGMSLWVCERSKSSGCSANIMLSYQDEKSFLEGDQSHNHDIEENIPVPWTVNGALMAQKKQKEVTYQHGHNYKITDGSLLFRGNFFKPGKPNSSTTSAIWNCTEDSCSVKVRVRRKIAALVNREHEHPPAVSRKRSMLAEETLQQGVNYRLISDETGHIRLLHRSHKYALETMRKNGTTEWVCTWERMGCKAVLKMVPDEQVVFGCAENDHQHRVQNALEQYFLPPALNTTPSRETVLWSCPEYELLWNSNCKPIVRRENSRFYARKAFWNGTVQWHCAAGVRTYCEASITVDNTGTIVEESLSHDHQRLRKQSMQKTLPEKSATAGTSTTAALFNSPGPVHLVAGGFNYRRMINKQLNIEIIVYCAHKYVVDDAVNSYHCVMRDEPEACPGKIVLTNNALCAELIVPHNHSTRVVRPIVQPDRLSQVTVEGPNYELIYSMTGRNCLLMHEGYAFRMYKLLEPSQSSRWRCVQGEAGCKTYLDVPLSLTKPASADGLPHDHSMVIPSVQLDNDATTVSQELCSVEVKVEEPSENEHPRRNTKTSSLAPCPRMITVKRELPMQMPDHHHRGDEPINDANAMTYFLNGHLYVRYFEGGVLPMTAEDEKADWICAFHWTLSCKAGLSDLAVHNHERFASVRTNDRFSMLKILIGHGIIAQRGRIALTPDLRALSEYELLPSNGNLSLIIDTHRYYFYKAKNNGEWLWRCVRHRWQGCKIGVAVSHCFGKYYFQPYGTTEHEHS